MADGPVFPMIPDNQGNTPDEYGRHGLTKRFYAAVHAMQGILASESGKLKTFSDKKGMDCANVVAVMAFELADALLAAEEEVTKP